MSIQLRKIFGVKDQLNSDDFQLFRIIQPNIKPHKAWTVAKSFPEFRSDAKYVVDLCSMVRYDNRQLLCDKCGKLSSNIYSYRVIEQETNEMTSGRTLLTLIRQILVCIWIICLLLTLYALCYPVTLHMNSTKTNCYFSLKFVCITWPPHVDSLIRVAINSRSFVSVSL